MAHRRTFAVLAILCVGVWLTGCRLIEPDSSGRSPLAPLAAGNDTVTLELFFARFPASDVQLGQKLWDEIDEQVVDPSVRRELDQYGIRAGIVGSQVPAALARLLTLTDAPATPSTDSTVPSETEPAVTMRLLAVLAGRRSEIVCSQPYEQVPILMREEGHVVGRTYAKAEGRFALRATPEKSGRVLLDLLPELHYGEPQQRWLASDGVIRLETSRPKRLFDELRMKVAVSPGQMLVIAAAAERPGSLGHYFFSETKADQETQKLLVLRLAQAGSDPSFVIHGARQDEPAVATDDAD